MIFHCFHCILCFSPLLAWAKNRALGANPWRGRVFDEPNLCSSSALGWNVKRSNMVKRSNSTVRNVYLQYSTMYSQCTRPVHRPSIFCFRTLGMASDALASVPCQSMHLARKVPVPVPSCSEAMKHGITTHTSAVWHLDTFWHVLIHLGTWCSNEPNGSELDGFFKSELVATEDLGAMDSSPCSWVAFKTEWHKLMGCEFSENMPDLWSHRYGGRKRQHILQSGAWILGAQKIDITFGSLAMLFSQKKLWSCSDSLVCLARPHTFPANCKRALVIFGAFCFVIFNCDQTGLSSLSGAGKGGTGAVRSGTRLKNSFITSLQNRYDWYCSCWRCHCSLCSSELPILWNRDLNSVQLLIRLRTKTKVLSVACRKNKWT